jgi:hypothetical protein
MHARTPRTDPRWLPREGLLPRPQLNDSVPLPASPEADTEGGRGRRACLGGLPGPCARCHAAARVDPPTRRAGCLWNRCRRVDSPNQPPGMLGAGCWRGWRPTLTLTPRHHNSSAVLGILDDQGQGDAGDGPKHHPMTTRSWPRRRSDWFIGPPKSNEPCLRCRSPMRPTSGACARPVRRPARWLPSALHRGLGDVHIEGTHQPKSRQRRDTGYGEDRSPPTPGWGSLPALRPARGFSPPPDPAPASAIGG